MAITVTTLGHSRVNPSVYLRPIAHTISNSPAINSASHATGDLRFFLRWNESIQKKARRRKPPAGDATNATNDYSMI
jgi:hypothetical protein